MVTQEAAALVEQLLDRYGCTIADQIKVNPLRGGDDLFELLGASMLIARRVNQPTALGAWLAVRERGWAHPKDLALAPWKQRVRLLDATGYVRSPERMSLVLGALADVVIHRYDGDLRNLRAAAERDPETTRHLLCEIKGVDDDVVDIFFREAQVAWEELFPFADHPVLETADRLGLPADAAELAELIGRERFLRLLAALAHVQRVDAFQSLSGDSRSAEVIDLRMEVATSAMRGAS
jgi:hypothetical protein